jgi:hypothetical protein
MDDYWVLNGLTKHFPGNDKLNEVNTGVGYERRFDNSSLGAGVLKDSFSHFSPYVQGTWYPEATKLGPVSLGLTGSLSYRQKAEGNTLDGLTLIPMISGEWMMTDNSGLNLGVVPNVTDKGGLAFLQYKHQFGNGDKSSPAAEDLKQRMQSARSARLPEPPEDFGREFNARPAP